MSDARTQAIHKAAAELVQELLNASAEEGSERWFHIVVRKMEGLPDRTPSKRPDVKLGLRFEKVRFDRNFATGGLDIAQLDRPKKSNLDYNGPEFDRSVIALSERETAKLKLWLNGE